MQHEISFGYDFNTKEETASCPCGWSCKSLSRLQVQLEASFHVIQMERKELERADG